MKYGCIGEHLKHSFSKEIHNLLADYDYEIREIERDCLDSFMEEKDFSAINVTIPYKELVIPHLYFIDEAARQIGAVNTVVNRGGRLYGYNTDFYGMSELIRHAGVSLLNKKVAILGTGGTSKTARAVAASLSCGELLVVSRRQGEGVITYDELYEKHLDTEVIINTTPLGMYPNIFGLAADISKFPRLSGVIDAVYNPLRTPIISEALKRGIAAEGGLYMLVAQAVRASEIFLSKSYPDGVCEKVFDKMLRQKENIVLIGMPASGKTTVGRLISERLGRSIADTDEMIVKNTKIAIPHIFAEYGEKYFRDRETEAVAEAAALTGYIISTGGGAVLREENISALKENGKIYFIDRPLYALVPTSDRPLSSSREDIEKRYHERIDIYIGAADVIIDADCSAEEVARKITEDHLR